MKIIIIGGGPGGYVAAIKAAMNGEDVTVIEKSSIGGTCLNVGCIPTKALLASTEILSQIENAGKFGLEVENNVKINFNEIMSRKDKIVKQLVSGIEFLFSKKGVKCIKGFGSLINKNMVKVQREDGTTETLQCDKIILATGSVPVIPKMFPYDGVKVVTSDELLNIKKLPASIIIVGGGPIGCEIGQFFKKIGTEITIVEMKDQIVPLEDEDVAKQLARSFKMDKIKVITNDAITNVSMEGNNVVAELCSGKQIKSELMLVSVGRKPYFQGLGLENIGIKTEKGKICVNDNMETNISGIFAIGDLVDSPALAHVAEKEGIIAVENASGRNKKVSYKAVPSCVFTDPEIASVGINEKMAKEKGIEYKIGKFDFRSLGKAQAIGKIQGFVKIIANSENKIIGASIVGPHATDMLGELTLAVQYEFSVDSLSDIIYPHPTLSEAVMEALHSVNNESIHSI
ncbi:MAG: lpdA [Clostridiaceae bacterium]|jgi:dihydrolipoamide dehydrogenase|nr:lpdA [Clostridiaceae bacterium]